MSSRWELIQELFLAAREQRVDARAAYVQHAAPDDAELRAQVLRMLQADAAEGILDRVGPVLALPDDIADDGPPLESVGPYLITGEIGRGGMGVVYRAHDPRLRRDVALKFLPAALNDDPDAKARFINEARAASALDHPNNCAVYDIGTTDDGRDYIAMAYCAGGSLATRLEAGPLAIDEAVQVAVQVAGALDRAHRAGIVHRDIKPANIAFTEHGEARVLDFGVAVLGTDEWAAPTLAAGTPAYMAPEQVRGDAVDVRTDVWALGAVLFEMLTGRRAFAGSRADVSRAILDAEPNDVRAVRDDVPPALAAAVARALAKDPTRRFASAAEFASAINAAGVASAGEARGAAARATRRRRALAVAALGTALAVGGAYVSLRGRGLTSGPTALDRGAVVILPFRVRGEPSIRYLREGMVDLLAAKLTGEGGLRAADPRGVYAAWRRAVRSESEDLESDSAVALSRRLGAGNVLLGDAVGSSASIIVNASIVNAQGTVIGRASAQGPHTQLSALVDRLAAQLLSASAGEEPQRLESLTSASLPALRAYLEGQAAYRRGRYAEAIEDFGRAVDLDSTFALAGLGLSLADGWVGTGHARDRGRAVAWRWRDRLSVRDRALLTAQVGSRYPRPPTVREQLTATEEALRLAPDRGELWYALGDLHLHFGRIVGGDGWEAQAERAMRRAVESDSTFAAPVLHLVGLYARQARHGELRSLVDASRTLGLEGGTADFIRWRSSVALGAGLDVAVLDSMPTETLGWIGMATQDDGVARAFGERAIRLRQARPSTREERFERHLGVHAVALNGGRPREATHLTELIREVQPDSSFYLRLRVLSAMYGDGDRLVAQVAATALGVQRDTGVSRRLNECVVAQWRLLGSDATSADVPIEWTPAPNASVEEQLCAATVAAVYAQRRRDPSAPEAISRVQLLLRSGLAEFYPGDGHLDYAPIAVARLLEGAGDRAGALDAIRRRPYFIGWQPFLAASLRHEARLARELGDRAGAIRALEFHLALRHDVEPSSRASTDSARADLARLRDAR